MPISCNCLEVPTFVWRWYSSAHFIASCTDYELITNNTYIFLVILTWGIIYISKFLRGTELSLKEILKFMLHSLVSFHILLLYQVYHSHCLHNWGFHYLYVLIHLMHCLLPAQEYALLCMMIISLHQLLTAQEYALFCIFQTKKQTKMRYRDNYQFQNKWFTTLA